MDHCADPTLISLYFQVVLSVILSVAVAAPQFLVDTPEVNAAKAQFYSAYNAALAATTAGQPAAAPVAADADGIVPYIHEEIEAEPYVHVEIPAEPYIHKGGAAVAAEAPIAVAEQPAAPAFNFNLDNTVYNNIPVQQVAFTGTCYNWRGEGVPCRTNFN